MHFLLTNIVIQQIKTSQSFIAYFLLIYCRIFISTVSFS